MADLIDKTRAVAGSYRSLLLEEPSPHKIKRFLLAVNGWCNSKCTFCNIWQYDKRLALKEELTIDEMERHLFASPALQDVLNIGLTGGEPFLRRDIVELCNTLFRHFARAHIGVVTNAIRFERVVDAAAAITSANPGREFSVSVSLDGYGETHDRVRGVPGNFERVLKAIEGLRAQAPQTLIGFSHTVTPTNMDDSLKCFELAQELDVGFMYRMAHNSIYLRNDEIPIWSDESLRAVKPIVEELNRRMAGAQSTLARLGNTNYASMGFYNNMLDYFETPRRTFECYSGTHSCFIAHNGDVYPCINLDMPMGNIRDQPFDDLWFGQRADEVRAPIAEWKCHCWTNCETEFSLSRQKVVFWESAKQNVQSWVE